MPHPGSAIDMVGLANCHACFEVRFADTTCTVASYSEVVKVGLALA